MKLLKFLLTLPAILFGYQSLQAQQVQKWSETPDHITVYLNNGQITIIPMDEGAARIHFTKVADTMQ